MPTTSTAQSPRPVNRGPSRGARWAASALVTLAIVLVPFAVFGQRMDAWTARQLHAAAGSTTIALWVVGLLAADLLLPVPSSLVGTVAGALLDVPSAWLASCVGMTLASQIGFLLGRRYGAPLAEQLISREEMARVAAHVSRRGIWAFGLLRPIPVLAEASAFWAGVMRISPLRYSMVTLVANAAVSAVYVAVGAAAIPARAVTLILAAAIALPTLALIAGLTRRREVAVLAVGLIAATHANAQTAQSVQPAPRFATEIVVTPERGETPKTSVPVATSVLDQETLVRLPATHLSEVMPFVTGFSTVRSEFHAGRPIVSARGFFGGGEAEYLLLLVDGVPMSDVESGLIDWSVVSSTSIARVEASRGPGSSFYGDSAVGGVVQVLTDRASSRGRLTVEGGSYATFIADGSYGRRRGGVSFNVSGVARSTDGAFEHSEGRQFALGGGVDGRAGRFVWQASAGATYQRRQDPGAVPRDAPSSADASVYRLDMTRRSTGRAAFTLRYDSARWRPQARVYAGVREEDSTRTILLAPEVPIPHIRDLSTTTVGGTFETEQQLALPTPLHIRFGVDVSRELLASAYRAIQPDAATVAPDGRRIRSGVFASAALQAAPRVRVSGAVRWDGVYDGGFDRRGAGSSPEAAWSPRAGVVVQADEAGTVAVFAQVSRAFKMPTLDQLFDVRPFPDFTGGTLTISNPLLQPQRATNLEAGISGRGRLVWSAVAYRMTVTNEIDFDVRTFSYNNIGRSRHAGLELDAEGRWWRRVRPSASYVLSRAAEAGTRAQLKNVPRHAVGVGASVGLGWSVGVHARYSRSWGAYLDDDNGLPLAGPSRLDVRIRRAVGRQLVFVDLYNATDDRFEEYGYTLRDFSGREVPYVYPGAGRAARVGVTVTF